MEAEIHALREEATELETTKGTLTKDDKAWLEAVKFELTIRQTEMASDAYLGSLETDATIKKRQCFLIDRKKLSRSR